MQFELKACILMFTLAAAAATAVADEPPEADQADQQWQEVYRKEAAGYGFVLQGQQPEALQMHPTAVMRWVSLNDYNGSVFVWTRQGRPELVGTIFSFPRGDEISRNSRQEFHSLSKQPIEATAADGSDWSLPLGIESKPIPGVRPPAMGASQRISQSRLLAREFSAHMDRQGERWELRLLNQPIYSYSESSEEVLGGAVFAFVGFITDPEILLLIEARQTPEGPKWFYAAARFSNKSLWLKHKDAEVWNYLENQSTQAPYFIGYPKVLNLNSSGN